MRTQNAPDSQACDINVMIPEGGMKKYTLSKLNRLKGTAIEDKAIVIESDCQLDVAAYNSDTFSNDGFLVLPSTSLGTEYRVVAYYPATLSTVMSVVPLSGATVTIQLPVHNNNPSSNPTVRNPATNTSVFAGQSFSVNLAQYQAMQVRLHLRLIKIGVS